MEKLWATLCYKKIDAFHHFHVDMDNYKCPFSWSSGIIGFSKFENPTSQIKIEDFLD
jgi:hypothetical protein